jgi:hypothetical protein
MVDFILVSLLFSLFATVTDLLGAGLGQLGDLLALLLEQWVTPAA